MNAPRVSLPPSGDAARGVRHRACGILAAVFVGVGVACDAPPVEQIQTTAPVAVAVVLARVGSIEALVSGTGIVAPAPGAELVVTAPQAARIGEIPRGEGDAVRKGDLLVRFDIPSLAADVAGRTSDLAQAEARLRTARAAADRIAGLFDHGIAARKELEDAQRELTDAQAALTQVRSARDAAGAIATRAVVQAPFDGIIAKRWHNPGDLVDAAASDPVLRVIDPSRLQVNASIAVADLSRITIGHPARVRGPGGEMLSATVQTRPAFVDAASSTAIIRLLFAERTKLASGTPVEVDIVAEQYHDAVIVPASAIVREQSDAFVYIAGSDQHAHRRPVKMGFVNGPDAQITDGVKTGEPVIVSGHVALPDGAAIAVQR